MLLILSISYSGQVKKNGFELKKSSSNFILLIVLSTYMYVKQDYCMSGVVSEMSKYNVVSIYIVEQFIFCLFPNNVPRHTSHLANIPFEQMLKCFI